MKNKRSAICVVITLVWLQAALADGCVLKKLGVYVPEREQRAFIEWADGKERLFIATRTDSSTDPTLWVLPIPGPPAEIVAEPAERFPHVAYERPVINRSRAIVRGTLLQVLTLDTGILPVGLFAFGFGGCGYKHAQAADVEVYSHVEKLGMVVEVLSAKSPDALDAYLAEKQMGVQANNITALEPYIREDYALVCAWTIKAHAERPARALRVDFPTPVVFYPLQPTRVYESAIDTSVYVRGWFKPEKDAPGLSCKHIHGRVADEHLDKVLGGRTGRDREMAFASDAVVDSSAEEPLTRIELSPLPGDWTEDVRLVEGAPAAIEMGAWIWRAERWFRLGVPSLTGAALGLYLPFVLFPAGKRRTRDYVWFAFTGATITFSIFVCAFFFFLYLREKDLKEPPVGDLGARIGLAIVAACFVLGVAWVIALGADVDLTEDLFAAGLSCFVIALVGLPITAAYLARATLRRGRWLILFAVSHLLVVGLICAGLDQWLMAYE